jgi:hypothetical protein
MTGNAEFIAYCIEEYKAANSMTGREVIDLFKKYNVIDWKAGVHTPANLWFELASVKFTATKKVVKPIFGPGYGPRQYKKFPIQRRTSGLAPRFFIILFHVTMPCIPWAALP